MDTAGGAGGVGNHAGRLDKQSQAAQLAKIKPQTKSGFVLFQQSHKTGFLLALKMVAGGGIEPPTQGFSVLCSTN